MGRRRRGSSLRCKHNNNNNNNNDHGRQLLDKSLSCTRAKVPTYAVNTHKTHNVPHAILVMEIMDTRDCPCRAFHRELRSWPAVEKTTIARGSFQWIPEIVLLQRSPLWLVNREHSVSLSFKCAAHSVMDKIIFILSIRQHTMLMDINIGAP